MLDKLMLDLIEHTVFSLKTTINKIMRHGTSLHGPRLRCTECVSVGMQRPDRLAIYELDFRPDLVVRSERLFACTKSANRLTGM